MEKFVSAYELVLLFLSNWWLSFLIILIRILQALQWRNLFSTLYPMLYPVMMLSTQSEQKTPPQKRQWCFQTNIGTKLRWQFLHFETSLSLTHSSLGQSSSLILLDKSIIIYNYSHSLYVFLWTSLSDLSMNQQKSILCFFLLYMLLINNHLALLV